MAETLSDRANPAPSDRSGPGARALDVAVTLLSLGTNKLLKKGTGWLTRNGLAAYIVPALVVNEAFGAYRAYLVIGAGGWW